MEKLSTTNVVTIVCVFVAGVLTVAGNILVREWYQPDVRYEVGSYYRVSDIAVTCELKNYGLSDAEEISLSASFPEPLVRDVSTDDAPDGLG